MEHSLSLDCPYAKTHVVGADSHSDTWIDHAYDGWLEIGLPNFSDDRSLPPGASISSDHISTNCASSSFNSARSCSNVSPVSSSWSDELTTPPFTPQSNRRWVMVTPKTSLPQSLERLNIINNMSNNDDTIAGDELWLPYGDHLPLIPTLHQKGSQCLNNYDGENDDHLLPINPYTVDPVISRQIFSDPICSPDQHTSGIFKAEWSSSVTWSTPQTIAPKVTIQSLLPSSPTHRTDVSSPLKLETFEQRVLGLDSSPLPLPSSRVVPSQRDIEEVQSFEQMTRSMPQPLLMRRSQGRSIRRSQPRKVLVSSSNKARKVADKISCDTVIPQNTFACSFPGCIDKGTGRQRRFKRQEHRKRHEITVHNAEKKFFCWVPACTTGFTRSDNLKTHIKNTHGKNNSAQRNRYVATLDTSSEYYDPFWEGGLTEDGYPLIQKVALSRCWVPDCGKIYHLEDKLQNHLSQHHGKRSADLDESFISSLEEDEAMFDSKWEAKDAAHESPAS